MKNPNSLTSLCAALTYAMGLDAPRYADAPNADLCAYLDKALSGEKADRIFMYNPDAIGQWIYEKYADMFTVAEKQIDIKIPFCTVMPSSTPICFGTMYTGALPQVHGIQSYAKPVITIDTIFDALIRQGRKPAIVATSNCSMGMIFRKREMDYFLFDNMEQVNAKAAELILRDEHDFIVVYNGNYDSMMHKYGPEHHETLAELRVNVRNFGMFYEMIAEHWKSHNTLIGFAMDHGCHAKEDGGGTHGTDMEKDLNIVHFYKLLNGVK